MERKLIGLVFIGLLGGLLAGYIVHQSQVQSLQKEIQNLQKQLEPYKPERWRLIYKRNFPTEEMDVPVTVRTDAFTVAMQIEKGTVGNILPSKIRVSWNAGTRSYFVYNPNLPGLLEFRLWISSWEAAYPDWTLRFDNRGEASNAVELRVPPGDYYLEIYFGENWTGIGLEVEVAEYLYLNARSV